MSAEKRGKAQKFQVLGALIQPARALAISALLISSSFLAGCSIVAQEQSSQAGETSVLLPWVKDGSYDFQRITLNSLVNVSSLQGTSAIFLLGPSISNSKLVGFQPRVRTFVDSQGSHVPTDSVSIQLLSLYAHMEKLDELDRQMGLGSLLPKPRVVGYDVRVKSTNGRRDQTENNALYLPTVDAYIFVPFKGGELPITVNGGVIAHEHFHALFNYLVLNNVRKKIKTVSYRVHLNEEKEMLKDFPGLESKMNVLETVTKDTDEWEVYHDNLLRAINEGLADIWGWVYSGDNIFVRRSLPVLGASRDLNVGIMQIQSLDEFRAYTRGAKLTGNQSIRAYELGTQFARTLKNNFDELIQEKDLPRTEVGRYIVKVLPKLEKRVLDLDTSEWMSPSVLIELFAAEMREDNPKTCKSLMRTVPELKETDIQSFCEVVADADPQAAKKESVQESSPETKL